MPDQCSLHPDDPASMCERFGPLPRQMLTFAERAAQTSAPVLLCGETGSGKTLLARIIHELSPRRAKPFERVNCGSIPESLFEREMFGHVKGAFTGAVTSQPGYFEAARGGTLLLDEIGDLAVSLQPKLLAVLEEGYIRRVGSTRKIAVDVRIIAATNRDLCRMRETKEFREDLFYRLRGLCYMVPPLRKRREQLPEIARRVLRRLAERGLIPPEPIPEIHPDALEILRTHSWPGNIRELEQVLTYPVTFFRTPVILPEHLPEDLFTAARANDAIGGDLKVRKARYVTPIYLEQERRLILETLAEEGGNRTRAAQRLGMARSTLWAKLKQYGIRLSS